MSDETINRILDMIESAGVVVMPVVIIGTILFLCVSTLSIIIIVKVAKELFSKD